MKIEKKELQGKKVKIIWLDLDDYKKCGIYPPDILIDRIVEFCETKKEKVFNGRRLVSVVLLRHIIIYFLRKYTQLSLTDIGRLVSPAQRGKHQNFHSNVLCSIKKIENWCLTDQQLRNRIEMIDEML